MIVLRLLLVCTLCAVAATPLVAKYNVRVMPERTIFPDMYVGSETTSTIVVRNYENKDLTITGLGLQVGQGQHFIIGQYPKILRAGDTIAFRIIFRPQYPGKFFAGYRIHFAGSTETADFRVEGIGRPSRPDIRIWPLTVNFGTVTTSTLFTRSIIVSNTTGTAPARFEDVDFLPGVKVFSFEGPEPPVDIGPGQRIILTFGFYPKAEGSYMTRATLRINNRETPIQLQGELSFGQPAPQPHIEVQPDVLDFGTVTTATTFTEVITVSNTTGTAGAVITGVRLSGKEFTLGRSVENIPIGVGQKVDIPIIFQPQEEKTYSTIATIETTAGEWLVTITGTLSFPEVGNPQLAATISVPEITANVGEEFTLPFTLDSISADAAANAASCRVIFRFNTTLMVPIGSVDGIDSTDDGMRTIALRAPVSVLAGQPLLSARMVAGLGDAVSTPIDLLSVEWFDASGTPLNVSTLLNDGSLAIGDIWKYGGVRLVNPNATGLSLEISPNPTLDAATLRMSYQSAPSLIVYDVMGNTVLLLTDMLPAPGPNPVTLQVDFSQLSSGTYYCRLSSGKFSLVRTLRIE